MKRWFAGLALAAWFAVSLRLRSVDLADSILYSGHHPSVAVALLMALPSALLSLSVILGPLWLTARHPITRDGVVVGVVKHLLLACTIGFVINFERYVISVPFAKRSAGLESNENGQTFIGVVGVYVLVVALVHAVEYAQHYRRKHIAEVRLQAELSQAELSRTAAELRMLKMQLNPHFLFNSLNALALLIPSTPAAAQRMVVELAELLRRAMQSVATQEVTLEEELAGLAPFIEIEQLRLGGGLTVEWQVAEEAREALVPHMLLQPLVENAIKHGIVPAGGRGVLRIGATQTGEWLELRVTNDGMGFAAEGEPAVPPPNSTGVGAANVRARLAQLYGTRQTFELRTTQGGETVALVHLPWHDEPMSEQHSQR
jgi:two-component system, LytTR family, sensor kinase